MIFIIAFFFALYPLTDTDIWWHLSAAREMLRTGSFLAVDPFSYTASNIPWLNLHWLYQLLVYFAHTITGIYGLIVLKALFFAGAFALIFRSTDSPENKKNYYIRLFIFAFFVYRVRFLMLDRPVMVTVLFMALFLKIGESLRDINSHLLKISALTLFQVLWNNMQGLSAIGPAIVLSFLIGSIQQKKTIKPLATLLLAQLLTLFVNPYGIAGFLLPFRLLIKLRPISDNLYSQNISENTPLFQLGSAEMHYAFTAAVVVFIAMFSLLYAKKRGLSHIILLLLFTLLAIAAVRNVLLLVVVSLYIINKNLSVVELFKNKRANAVAVTTALFVIFSMIVLHGTMLFKCRGLDGVSPFRIPDKELIAFFKSNPIQGNCFNGDRYGGYVSWILHPAKKVFIDGRFTIKPEYLFREYLSVLDRPELFEVVAKKYAISHALLPVAVFDRHLKLAKYLYNCDGWNLHYFDGSSVLLVRQGFVRHNPIVLTNSSIVDSLCEASKKRWDKNSLVAAEAVANIKDKTAFLTTNESFR